MASSQGSPHSAKAVQANGTADPYAGAYAGASMRPPKQGNAFNRATAFVLADSHQDYVVHSRLRNVLRALIVFGVFAAVIALTAVKYATDDDLRGSTITVREENIGKLSGARIEVAICPCQNDTLYWSTFTTFRAPLTLDFVQQNQLCRNSIVPQLANATVPTADSPIEDVRAYTRYLTTLQQNVGTVIACSLAVQDVVAALDPDPNAHIIGFGDNFFSTELLSERQARQRLDTFIGGKVALYNQDFASQLVLQRLVLSQLQSNFSDVIAAANATGALNDTGAANAVDAAMLSFDLYANITNDALTTLTDTASDQRYVDRLLNAMKGAVTLNYTTYQDSCMPFYCDYTKNKSTWSRVTEFLGLLGGLYTTCLGLGFTAWFLVDMMLPDGHGKFMV